MRVDNAHTVGDFQSILSQAFKQITMLREKAEQTAADTEYQMARLRVELRMAQIAAQPAPEARGNRDDKLERVYVKAMSNVVSNCLT